MATAQGDHLLPLFVAQSQCNPLLREKCDVYRLLTLYSFKKTVVPVVLWFRRPAKPRHNWVCGWTSLPGSTGSANQWAVQASTRSWVWNHWNQCGTSHI